MWGDFVLPAKTSTPVLMVAADIVHAVRVTVAASARLERQGGGARDVVFVYVASGAEELAFRQDLEDSIPVIVFTRDEPTDLPPHWTWARACASMPPVSSESCPTWPRHARHLEPRVSSPTSRRLGEAHGLTTDAFSGY
ncbi:MAG: hypothetical protein R2692_03655 [Microbacterium sp.]